MSFHPSLLRQFPAPIILVFLLLPTMTTTATITITITITTTMSTKKIDWPFWQHGIPMDSIQQVGIWTNLEHQFHVSGQMEADLDYSICRVWTCWRHVRVPRYELIGREFATGNPCPWDDTILHRVACIFARARSFVSRLILNELSSGFIINYETAGLHVSHPSPCVFVDTIALPCLAKIFWKVSIWINQRHEWVLGGNNQSVHKHCIVVQRTTRPIAMSWFQKKYW